MKSKFFARLAVFAFIFASCAALGVFSGGCSDNKGEETPILEESVTIVCGDGICSTGEAETCVADCPPSAGGSVVCNNNGACDAGAGETIANCPADCPAGGGGDGGGVVCNNNGTCDAGTGETIENCPADCSAGGGGGSGGVVCNNNGTCDAGTGETIASCPADCPAGGGGSAVCGNAICESGETMRSCLADCPPGSGSGACNNDHICNSEAGETPETCPGDCATIGGGEHGAGEPAREVVSLNRPDGVENGNKFGYSVSISGNLAVVGVPDYKVGVSGYPSGMASIYRRSAAGRWNLEDELNVSNLNPVSIDPAHDELGYSVATDGDFVVIGAPGEDGDGTAEQINSGAVYVFKKADSGSHWRHIKTLRSDNIRANSQCGYSVAVTNYKPGIKFILFGCPGYFENKGETRIVDVTIPLPPRAGAIIWSQDKLLPRGSESGDKIGTSVAVSGTNIIIGAPGSDKNIDGVVGEETDVGMISFFKRTAAGWEEIISQQKYGSATNAKLGYSVDINGNLAVAGEPGVKHVNVYLKTGDLWNIDGSLTLQTSNPRSNEMFGASVGIFGNYLVIGSPNAGRIVSDGFGTRINEEGRIRIYSRSGPDDDKWLPITAMISEPTPVTNGHFGHSVDITANGTTIIGVDRTTDAGAAYIW